LSSFNQVVEGVGAGVGALVALLGAPTVFLGIRKSKVEIRKLELEALKLQSEMAADQVELGPDQKIQVNMEGGTGNIVSIATDLRLLGPLLLLLDFVAATIVLTVAGYLLSFGDLNLFSPFLAVLGIVLLTPIFREARRLKKKLTPDLGVQSQEEPHATPSGQ
jgi:hypothetical protein